MSETLHASNLDKTNYASNVELIKKKCSSFELFSANGPWHTKKKVKQ